MHEFELIKNYFQKLSNKSASALNLNDDVFFDKKNRLVVSVDTYTEGNHFIDFKKPDLVIKKIIRSSISDLICKGITPKYYFIAASGNKKKFDKINLSKILNALKSEQKKFSIKLSGGDTTYSSKLSFTFVVVGYPNNLPILRSGANLNDDIYVTNTLGDAFLGLYLIKKRKRTSNYNYFVKSFYLPNIPYKFSKQIHLFASSSIDISDGLYQDINHLIKSSNLSYDLDLNKVPISNYLKNYIKKNNKKKKLLISNGDDYQILFTAKKNKRNLIKRIAKKTNTLVMVHTKQLLVSSLMIKMKIIYQGVSKKNFLLFFGCSKFFF